MYMFYWEQYSLCSWTLLQSTAYTPQLPPSLLHNLESPSWLFSNPYFKNYEGKGLSLYILLIKLLRIHKNHTFSTSQDLFTQKIAFHLSVINTICNFITKIRRNAKSLRILAIYQQKEKVHNMYLEIITRTKLKANPPFIVYMCNKAGFNC